MRLISVNRGAELTHMKGTEPETTGIYKMPVEGPVFIDRLGLEGDFIGDPHNHGGPDQAIYVYGSTDYRWWEGELGRVLPPGTFGENLTISELESAQCCIGDRLRVGSIVLEVTAPRTPCSTLAARMGTSRFVKAFRQAERPGLYCRVIETGTASAEAEVVRIPYSGEPVTILELFQHHHSRASDAATLRRFLSAPVSIRARASLERDLQKALAGQTG